MRLFTAIELPDAVRDDLSGLRAKISAAAPKLDDAVTWVKPQNLHVTLKFLGEVPDDKLMDVCRALGGVEVKTPLALHVAGIGFFPPRGPVRVVVARLGGETDALARLYGDVEQALHALGFPLDHRPFTPHVTLGRTRCHGHVANTVRDRLAGMAVRSAELFQLDSFTLFQSRLTRAGAEYERLARFPPTRFGHSGVPAV